MPKMEDQLGALTTIFTEVYYWITVVFMFLIHIGFCMYEVGASRRKNMMHTLMKNTMVIPLVTVTFFYFGWYIYFGWNNGIPGLIGADAAPYGLTDINWAAPWSPLMGNTLNSEGDGYWSHINGVFWAAFLLFSWTAASIVSGAVIERIRSGAFWILAVVIGSFTWIIDASWGWHPDGWMVRELGYHDAYASGVIHAIAGGFALGVLVVLGPRIGKFAADGTPRNIVPHNPWLVTIGLFLIYTGFWGFYVACNIPIIDIGAMAGMEGSFYATTNIYLTPTTTSAITFNFLMSLSGGLMMGYIVSKGDAFWTYSSGLGGVIAASAGNDLYHPIQAMLVAAFAVPIFYYMHSWVERKFKIDDAVGAVAVHGYAGIIGLLVAGFMLWGYPSSMYAQGTWGQAIITPWGQAAGAFIMFFVLGFAPAWIVSKILNAMGLLRIPERVEIAGLDLSEFHGRYLDEAEVDAAEEEEARNRGLI
jgi:Amt family ammonium transporter